MALYKRWNVFHVCGKPFQAVDFVHHEYDIGGHRYSFGKR
jgi:hypothetical protein